MSNINPDDFFAQLDASIVGVVAKPQLEKRKLEIERALRDKHITDTDVFLLNDELKEVREKITEIVWQPTANVAMVALQQCRCGKRHTMFRELMQRQISRVKPLVERWARTDTVTDGLPYEVIYEFKAVKHCSSCLSALGFHMPTGKVKVTEDGHPVHINYAEFFED